MRYILTETEDGLYIYDTYTKGVIMKGFNSVHMRYRVNHMNIVDGAKPHQLKTVKPYRLDWFKVGICIIIIAMVMQLAYDKAYCFGMFFSGVAMCLYLKREFKKLKQINKITNGK